MSYVVEIENLTKDYETGFWKKKKTRALDGISLSVSGGQIFGFLGGNGAGKTTTIKILMSLLYPSTGTARVLGKDIAEFTMHREIGYCPENPYFYDYLTPLELLSYFGELFGISTRHSKPRSEELLAKVGLEEKDWNKQLRKFSKGMLQRVGLAQSLINDPQIVFLDEPMSGLDPIGRREVRELIAELRTKGTTVFMSTHILSDVEALCDEVAILSGGVLSATGKLDDLLAASEGMNTFEIYVKGLDTDAVVTSPDGISFDVTRNSSFAIVTVDRESDIEQALAAVRKSGGTLVQVQPLRRSLEEYFVASPTES